MTDIVQNIEQRLETFGEKVKAKVVQWAGEAEQFVEQEAEAGWTAAKTVLTALAPKLWANALNDVRTILAELGDAATVETVASRLLNALEDDAKAAWTAIEPNLLTAVVSTLIATAKAAL